MAQQALRYEIIRHGVEHSDYFQGCGTYGTTFDNVVTGIGMNEREACRDALDNLCTGIDVSPVTIEAIEIESNDLDTNDLDDGDERFWHVSIRWSPIVRIVSDAAMADFDCRR